MVRTRMEGWISLLCLIQKIQSPPQFCLALHEVLRRLGGVRTAKVEANAAHYPTQTRQIHTRRSVSGEKTMYEQTIAETRKRATAMNTSRKKRPVTPEITQPPRLVKAKQRGSVVIEWCRVKWA
ncbi:hypothetical protein BLNAU_15502 [Blattamonas nauphoetae]|uniref:Secreted protein n=1 Tax=Blattamonas nauphoetae TaxID=2049346 RepID=A0ABQ9XDT4_9EUKA|nr:hypothetical protein BLNAU_15502 [Blattamonas nauphoetae]